MLLRLGCHSLQKELVQRQILFDRAAQRNFAGNDQAASQMPFGGQAQTVAILAKMLTDRRNEANGSLGAWNAKSARRPISAGARHRLQIEVAQASVHLLYRKVTLIRGREAVPPILDIADRHYFDETNMPGVRDAQGGQVEQFVIVHAADDDGVKF